MLRDRKYEGFSLIEILIVVGLILILAAVTIVAINPAKHFRDTRNAERSADVSEILNAVTQFAADEDNVLGDLGTIPLCSASQAVIGEDGVDLADSLVDEYIVEIPMDPDGGTAEDTGYTICQTDGGRVQITAEKEVASGEAAEDIVVSR